MSMLSQMEDDAHQDESGAIGEVLHLVPAPVEKVTPETEEHDANGPVLSAVTQLAQREQNYRRLLGVADGVASLVVTGIAIALSGRSPTWGVVFVPLLAVLVAKIEGLYDRDDQVIQKANIAEWRPIVRAAAVVGIGVYLSWRVLTNATSGGGMRLFLFLVAATSVLTVILRAIARRLARKLSVPERCVIIADPRRVSALAQRLGAAQGVELVGMVSEDALIGSVAELRSMVEELHFHRLVISPSAELDGSTLHLIQAAKFLGVRVSLLPGVMTAVGGFATIEELDGMTLLGVPRFGLSHSSVLLKRGFDVVIGTFALIALAPILLAISVAIKLTSQGPVIFKQTRIGRGGKPFRIWKFRSMVDGADGMKDKLMLQNEATGGLFKIVDDPRITRVGQHIRSTHLDELPQLVNVLRGEMSLVGPRPLVPDEDARVKGRDRHRIHLTPGITGPWQVKGPLNTPLAEMAMLDYRYASDWSIWRDLDILAQTVFRVLSRGGH